MKMSNTIAGGVYVVAVTKNGKTEYWAAATEPHRAVEIVKKHLRPGWIAFMTERRLSPQRVGMLKLMPNTVRRIKEAK